MHYGTNHKRPNKHEAKRKQNANHTVKEIEKAELQPV